MSPRLSDVLLRRLQTVLLCRAPGEIYFDSHIFVAAGVVVAVGIVAFDVVVTTDSVVVVGSVVVLVTVDVAVVGAIVVVAAAVPSSVVKRTPASEVSLSSVLGAQMLDG